jgi:hypothetical protein
MEVAVDPTSAVFDHSGLCIVRGTDFEKDDGFERARAVALLLMRSTLLCSRHSERDQPAGSLAASLDPPATVASPFPRSRSNNALMRPLVYESQSNLGSSVATDGAFGAKTVGLPVTVCLETSHEMLWAVATEAHISIMRAAPAMAGGVSTSGAGSLGSVTNSSITQ